MRGASLIVWQLKSSLKFVSSPGTVRRPISFVATGSRFRPRSTPVINCSATAGSLRVGSGASWPESRERARLLELARCRLPRWRARPVRTLLRRVAAADVRRCSARARTPAAARDRGDLRGRHCFGDAADRARCRPSRAAVRRAAPRHLLRGRVVSGAAGAASGLRPALATAVPDAAASCVRIDAGRHIRPRSDGGCRQLLLRARARWSRGPICPCLICDRRPGAWPRLRLRHGLPAPRHGAGLGSCAPRRIWLRGWSLPWTDAVAAVMFLTIGVLALLIAYTGQSTYLPGWLEVWNRWATGL